MRLLPAASAEEVPEPRPVPARRRSLKQKTAILAAVQDLEHVLLQLLPYRDGIEGPLAHLQSVLLVALDPQAPRERRIGRLLELNAKDEAPCRRLPDGQALFIALLGRLAPLFESPMLYEALCSACLQDDGLMLIDEVTDRRTGLPRLRRLQNFPRDSEAVEPNELRHSRALKAVAELIGTLERRSPEALAAMPTGERVSALRLLALHALYGVGRHLIDETERRRRCREYFDSVGLGLWQALAVVGPDLDVGDRRALEHCGGEARRNLLGHALRADVPAAATKAPSTWPPAPESQPEAEAGELMHRVVTMSIPPASSVEDRLTLSRYERLREPLPLRRLPSMARIEEIAATLEAEFPWATQAVQAIRQELQARRGHGAATLGLAPLLLVGAPGCGKSRLARRLAEELGVGFHPLALGGMGDSRALLGTARGWATGQPSPLLEAMLVHECANVLVLLDEIDKAGVGDTTNCRPPAEALLNLLEPETARRWMDAYLQVPCDLRPLLFCATANRLGPIAAPLRDRLRIVSMGQPQAGHLAAIARAAVADLEKEWGLPAGALPVQEIGAPPPGLRSAREVRRWVRDRLALRGAGRVVH